MHDFSNPIPWGERPKTIASPMSVEEVGFADHAMTAAGYRVTRWADDFVVSAEPVKKSKLPWPWRSARQWEPASGEDRIVHVDPGSFLGYQGAA